jgi:hypothetical protein
MRPYNEGPEYREDALWNKVRELENQVKDLTKITIDIILLFLQSSISL